ncbi:MAG: aspartate aminotransferase family protein, partial [Gammaproteobacteria bacterium]|nr:aspartate aminotransferase family protein [Gammaproteobacteria bacterium]
LDVYESEDIFAGARALEPAFEQAIHAMRDARHVIDVRNFGLMGCVEIAPRDGAPGARGLEVHVKAFENGVFVRNGMDNLQFCPFLTSTPELFEQTFEVVRKVLETVD